ncbi:MAG: peptidylprolyl isomerase [Acidobacteriota bacterium]|nr:peptidylprolyl isomerase [Acidobacteriota bacterium]
MIPFILGLGLLTAFPPAFPVQGGDNPRVLVRTEMGDITIEVALGKAPVTAANFLRYVDAGLYDGTVFHRTVTRSSPRNQAVPIEVIQGGQVAEDREFAAVPLERTNATGLMHIDAAVSMARSGPDTATSSFFICVGGQPELDFGGKRNADGQGFAVFGRVVAGMEVARRIHASPVDNEEHLTPPVRILSAARLSP